MTRGTHARTALALAAVLAAAIVASGCDLLISPGPYCAAGDSMEMDFEGCAAACTGGRALFECGTDGRWVAAGCTCGETCVDHDGDGYGDGPACLGTDCNDNDSAIWVGCDCADTDGDHHGVGTDCEGADCDDYDAHVWVSCGQCDDGDGDTYFGLCDDYMDRSGPDCDDANPNAWIACGTCADSDEDGLYGVCDAYVGITGGDCDDTTPFCTTSCPDLNFNGNPDCNEIATVDAGSSYTCAVNRIGIPFCWGYNGLGVLGVGDDTNRDRPARVPVSDISRVATGYDTTCAVDTWGGHFCWGTDLGDAPVEGEWGGVAQSATGKSGGCWIDAYESWLLCWGSSDNCSHFVDIPYVTYDAPQNIFEGVVSYEAVSLGYDFGLALASDGRIVCTGLNYYGQCGLGSTSGGTCFVDPTYVSGISGVSRISAGWRHACALTSAGNLYCWGDNGGGQAGAPTTTDPVLAPRAVSGIADPVQVSAGQSHTCAVTGTGSLYCWGANGSGQLGTGTDDDTSTPTLVTGISDVKEVACGTDHTCAITNDFMLYCWGGNGSGQLGLGGGSDRATPELVN